MSTKPFVIVPNEIIEQYGLTDKLLCWIYIHKTRDFDTNEPTVSVRILAAETGIGRHIAHQVLAAYGDKVGTKWGQQRGQQRGQAKSPPEPARGDVGDSDGDSSGDDSGTKRGHLRPVEEVSPISNSGIQEKEKETTTTTPDGPYKDLLTAEEMFNIFWQDSTGKGSKKKAKDIWLRLCNLPVKVLEKEHEVSTHLSLYRKIYQRMQGWRKSEDWTKENGKFMPNVTTWLNGECWNNKVPDELHRSFRRMF